MFVTPVAYMEDQEHFRMPSEGMLRSESLPAVRDSDSITRGLTIGFRKYEKDHRNDVTYRG